MMMMMTIHKKNRAPQTREGCVPARVQLAMFVTGELLQLVGQYISKMQNCSKHMIVCVIFMQIQPPTRQMIIHEVMAGVCQCWLKNSAGSISIGQIMSIPVSCCLSGHTPLSMASMSIHMPILAVSNTIM